jgi:hypothetical protein
LERYFGNKFNIDYSFWKMAKRSTFAYWPKKFFAKKKIFLYINIIILLITASLILLNDHPRWSAYSTIGGLSILVFLAVDFYHEHLTAKT